MVSLSPKIISRSFTALVVLLAFPAIAIMASWNSLPGDFLYPVKRGLEKTALVLTPNSFLESELRLKLLDRRTTEVANSITKSPGNTQSLNELIAEAKAAEYKTIELKPDQRTQATTKLISKLTQTSQQLESVKNTVSPSTNTYIPPPATSTPQEQSSPESIIPPPINNPPSEKPVTTPSPQITEEQAEETIESIEEAQEELEEIIEELSKKSNKSNKFESKDKDDKDHDKDDKDKGKDKDDKDKDHDNNDKDKDKEKDNQHKNKDDDDD